MGLPGHPAANGERENHEQCDQRAHGTSVEAFPDCHKVAGVQGRKDRLLVLENEFCSELNQAGRIGTDDLPEGGAADVAVHGLRSEKLSVVENIETFQPK